MATDASVADAAILAIGDICETLAPVACARDAECFDSFEPPCDQSFLRACCQDDGICDLVNGVASAQLEECVNALMDASCEEIENEFPPPCTGITSPDGN